MTDNLFDDYEEDFEDEDDEFAGVDRTSVATIFLGVNEICVPVQEGQTIGEALEANQSVLGFRSLSALNVQNTGKYVGLSQPLKAGEVYKISSATDEKGN